MSAQEEVPLSLDRRDEHLNRVDGDTWLVVMISEMVHLVLVAGEPLHQAVEAFRFYLVA